jgi:ubiquinone/menaquinone biosynthesis C-methylase UbiE
MYFMDSPTEGQRLERKTDTIQVGEHLLRSGLRLGMLALDIACGTGAVTRVMAKITGPGCTTGIDMSAGRIAQARQFADAEKLSMEFVDGFADQIPFPDNTFDFTHARFLFEYLPNPLEVLAEMRRVTRLGGLVVVSDLDGQINSLYPMSEQLTSEVQDALSILSRTGFDPQVGRKLLHWFAETGLEDTTLSVIPYQVYSGNLSESDIANWQDKLATSVAFLVKQTGDTARWNRFRQNYLTALLAPDAFYYSTIITARGHAPKTQNGQIPFTEVD